MSNSSAGRSTTTPEARAAADVRWADFVADLPALIHPAPPNPSSQQDAPRLRGRQRQHVNIVIAARRVHASGSHVPRGYRMRPGKPGTALAVRSEQPAVATEPERREPPVMHATPVSTLVLPHFGHDVRMALAPADRVFLGAMSLMGGAVMAAIVAVLVLRGRGDAASATVPTSPSAQVAPAIVAPVAQSDSVRHGPTTLASTATTDTVVAGTPEPHEKAPAARATPSREAAAATSRSSHGSARAPRRARPDVVTLGRSERPDAVPTTFAPAPARATPQQPAPVRATPQPPAAVATRSVAAASASPPVSGTAMPTPMSGTATPTPAPAAQNINVAEELRAIRTEIEARQKHVDSLAHALDSMNKSGP